MFSEVKRNHYWST